MTRCMAPTICPHHPKNKQLNETLLYKKPLNTFVPPHLHAHTHTLQEISQTPSRQLVSHLVPYLMVMDSRYDNNCRWSGLHIALRNDEEYEESEVWEVLDDNGGSTDHSPAFYHGDEPRAPIRKNMASVVSGIPRPRTSSGASRVQKSAPVNISYWGKDSTGSSSSGKKKELRDDSEVDEKEGESDEEEDEEGEEGGYVDCEPRPHEFIAKRLARSHISSFSVLEGAGRKLKGRDLSKVRHAVLTKTGFLDPPSNLDSN